MKVFAFIHASIVLELFLVWVHKPLNRSFGSALKNKDDERGQNETFKGDYCERELVVTLFSIFRSKDDVRP